MAISGDHVEFSLLALLASRGSQVGEQVPLASVETDWEKTSLRRSDLLNAVAQACMKGWIDICDSDEASKLSLTESGFEKAREILSAVDGGWQAYLKDAILSKTRRSNISEGPDGKGRRDYEAPEHDEIPWTRH